MALKPISSTSSNPPPKMAPPGLFNLLDPTLHFLLGSFVSIVFIDADADAKTLSVKLPSVCAWSTRPHARVLLTRFGPHPRHSPTHACTHTHTQTAELAAHFIDPGVFVGLAVLAVFLFAVRNETKPLSTSQSLRANWHLWNAVLIYTMMDGLNGAFSEYGFLHTLHTKGYQLVDRRYSRHLIGKPSGPSAYEAAVAQTLNGTELIVYSWMSLLAAVGSCQQDAKWHKSIELIVLTMVRGSWCAVLHVCRLQIHTLTLSPRPNRRPTARWCSSCQTISPGVSTCSRSASPPACRLSRRSISFSSTSG